MFEHATKIRVRYGETDQMGYMYYGNYAEFYEVGRVEMLRSLGLTYSGMEESGIKMPVLAQIPSNLGQKSPKIAKKACFLRS